MSCNDKKKALLQLGIVKERRFIQIRSGCLGLPDSCAYQWEKCVFERGQWGNASQGKPDFIAFLRHGGKRKENRGGGHIAARVKHPREIFRVNVAVLSLFLGGSLFVGFGDNLGGAVEDEHSIDFGEVLVPEQTKPAVVVADFCAC